MHSEQHNGWSFHFNTDCSGDVIINRPRKKGEEPQEITIPAEALMSFVGQRIIDRTIAVLEQVDGKQIGTFLSKFLQDG
jgi:hypothetical protein